jgi:hypothetical protein
MIRRADDGGLHFMAQPHSSPLIKLGIRNTSNFTYGQGTSKVRSIWLVDVLSIQGFIARLTDLGKYIFIDVTVPLRSLHHPLL